MFHGVGMDIPSGVRLEQKNSQEILEGILADQTRIASILTEHTALDAADARDLFKEARTKATAYALANLIISDIRDVDIPIAAAPFYFVFQRHGIQFVAQHFSFPAPVLMPSTYPAYTRIHSLIILALIMTNII